MATFEDAIRVAKNKVKAFIPDSQNISLESAVLSDDQKVYEVTLSYDLRGEDPSVSHNGDGTNQENGLSQLVKIMGYRRKYKKFLIDYTTGDFRGFKNEK